MIKYIYALLVILWLFLGMYLLSYEGYKMFHNLSKEDRKYDWILEALFVVASALLVIMIF